MRQNERLNQARRVISGNIERATRGLCQHVALLLVFETNLRGSANINITRLSVQTQQSEQNVLLALAKMRAEKILTGCVWGGKIFTSSLRVGGVRVLFAARRNRAMIGRGVSRLSRTVER